MHLDTIRNLCDFEDVPFTIYLGLVNVACCNKTTCLLKSLQL